MEKKAAAPKTGSKHPKAKLTAVQIRKIRKLLEKGAISKAQIARDHDVSPLVITRIQNGTAYKDVV